MCPPSSIIAGKAIAANISRRSSFLGLGLSTPIPRQEDIGIDFLCSLADQRSGVLTFGNPYLVSVKSLSKPNIVLEPTEAAITENNPRHLHWLFRQELPLFLGVVDKGAFSMRLYRRDPENSMVHAATDPTRDADRDMRETERRRGG